MTVKTVCLLSRYKHGHVNFSLKNALPKKRHQTQEPRQPLKPTLPPEWPWQHLGADLISFYGGKYLVIIDYYSKMRILPKMPTSQCTAAKTITHLKELFAEHGIPESISSDNGPQFSSHLFKEFAEKWNFTNSCSNGQAESVVKIIKDLLTRSKCAGEDPYLALLAYRSTRVDSFLQSPGEMLHQCILCTTQKIKHQDSHAAAKHVRLEDQKTMHHTQSAANHDHTGCSKKAPLQGQTVSGLNNDQKYQEK